MFKRIIILAVALAITSISSSAEPNRNPISEAGQASTDSETTLDYNALAKQLEASVRANPEFSLWLRTVVKDAIKASQADLVKGKLTVSPIGGVCEKTSAHYSNGTLTLQMWIPILRKPSAANGDFAETTISQCDEYYLEVSTPAFLAPPTFKGPPLDVTTIVASTTISPDPTPPPASTPTPTPQPPTPSPTPPVTASSYLSPYICRPIPTTTTAVDPTQIALQPQPSSIYVSRSETLLGSLITVDHTWFDIGQDTDSRSMWSFGSSAQFSITKENPFDPSIIPNMGGSIDLSFTLAHTRFGRVMCTFGFSADN